MDCIRAHDLTRYVACASCCSFGLFASRSANLHQTKIDWLGSWILYWMILLIYSICKCCCRVKGFFSFFPVVGRKKTSCFRMQRRSLFFVCFNWVYEYSWVKFEFIIVFKLIFNIFRNYSIFFNLHVKFSNWLIYVAKFHGFVFRGWPTT